MIKIKSRTESTNRIEKVANNHWYRADENVILDFTNIKYNGDVLAFETPIGRMCTRYDKLVKTDEEVHRDDVANELDTTRIGFQASHFESLEVAVAGVFASIGDYNKVRFRVRHIKNGDEYMLAVLEMDILLESGKTAVVMFTPLTCFGLISDFFGGRSGTPSTILECDHEYEIDSDVLRYCTDGFGDAEIFITIDLVDRPRGEADYGMPKHSTTLPKTLKNLYRISSAKTVDFHRNDLNPNELIVVCHSERGTYRFVIYGPDVDFHKFWRW